MCKNSYKALVGKFGLKGPFRSRLRRWEDNIKVYFKRC